MMMKRAPNSDGAELTACWLERAGQVLSKTINRGSSEKLNDASKSNRDDAFMDDKDDDVDVQQQLLEVKQLLEEAPVVMKSTSSLVPRSDRKDTAGATWTSDPVDATTTQVVEKHCSLAADSTSASSSPDSGQIQPPLSRKRERFRDSEQSLTEMDSAANNKKVKESSTDADCCEPQSLSQPQHLTTQQEQQPIALVKSDESKDDILDNKGEREKNASDSSNTPRRRGKWTSEEENYVTRIVHDFNEGYIDAPAGATLRSYLSEQLHCDPMRITKKFTGEACIGKRVYHPLQRTLDNASRIETAQKELKQLREAWKCRLQQQKQEAAAAAISKDDRAFGSTSLSAAYYRNLPEEIKITASWLDRASSILTETWHFNGAGDAAAGGASCSSSITTTTEKVSPKWYKVHLKQIQQLLSEAKLIQETSVKLPKLIESFTATIGGNEKNHSGL